MVKKLFLGLLCTCGVVCGSYAYNNYSNNVIKDNVNNVVVAQRKNAIQSSDLVVGKTYLVDLSTFDSDITSYTSTTTLLSVDNYSFIDYVMPGDFVNEHTEINYGLYVVVNAIPGSSASNHLTMSVGYDNGDGIYKYSGSFNDEDFSRPSFTFVYESDSFVSPIFYPYMSVFVEPTLVDNIFDVTEDVIGGFNVVLSDSVTTVQNLFWDVDGFTTLGTILCIGLGVGLVLWAFRLIKSLIKHRG